MIDAIKDCTKYPDSFSKQLRQCIAEFENTLPENIICSNGASDLIFRLASTLKPKKALVLAPTFSDYERALAAVDCNVCRYMLYEENGFLVKEDILTLIEQGHFNIVFICNPNNPTGCITARDTIGKVIHLCRENGCFVVIDECFMDFVPHSEQFTVRPMVREHKNMLVLRAFTKIFALAGVRLGYGISSNEELIDKLYTNSPDWSVSVLAQAAGIASLHNAKDYIKNTLDFVKAEKNRIQLSLKYLDCEIFGSRANYLFFKTPNRFDLKSELLNNHRIFIRSCENYHGLNGQFYRIGVQCTEYNNCILRALEDMLNSGGING